MTHHKSDQAKIKDQNKRSQNKSYSAQKRPPKKITKTYLHNSGLYYLERFAASKKHFIFVMSRKVMRSCAYHKDQDYNDCISMVHELADRFEKAELLNDKVFSENVINSLRKKGFSKNAILARMAKKGIARDLTLSSLNEVDTRFSDENPEEAEKEAALRFAKRKRIGPFSNGRPKDYKKSLGMMARAGFSYELSNQILGNPDDNTVEENF